MKKIFIISVCAFSLSVIAEPQGEAENKSAKFEELKSNMLQNIDLRISKLTEHKSCVSAASDKDALKNCHEKMKEFRQEMRGKRDESRKARKGK
jgi:hypothetical protein